MSLDLKEKSSFILKFLKTISSKNLSPKKQNQLLCAFLSPAEIESLEHRIHILQALLEAHPQRVIAQKYGVGIATVTRANKILQENRDLLEEIF